MNLRQYKEYWRDSSGDCIILDDCKFPKLKRKRTTPRGINTKRYKDKIVSVFRNAAITLKF